MNNVKRRGAGTARAESTSKRPSEAEGHLGTVRATGSEYKCRKESCWPNPVFLKLRSSKYLGRLRDFSSFRWLTASASPEGQSQPWSAQHDWNREATLWEGADPSDTALYSARGCGVGERVAGSGGWKRSPSSIWRSCGMLLPFFPF